VILDYQKMFDDFEASAIHELQGLFGSINLKNTNLGGSEQARAKILNAIVKLVNQFEFHDENGKDILGAVYEFMLAQFAASAGKSGGEFYTPYEVSKLLSKIVTSEANPEMKEFKVMDPTCGSGSLLLNVEGQLPFKNVPVIFYGQEKNPTTYNLARMNLMMHGVKLDDMHVHNGDTLEGD